MNKKRGSAVFRMFSGFQKENSIFVISCDDRKCVELYFYIPPSEKAEPVVVQDVFLIEFSTPWTIRYEFQYVLLIILNLVAYW